MQEDEFFARKETFDHLQRLVDFNCANLSRKDDIGSELAFDEIIPVAKDAIELLRVFDQQDVMELPAPIFNPLKSYVDQFTAAINQVGRFTTTMHNAGQERSNILSYFVALRDGMYRDLLSTVSWLKLRKSDLRTLDERANSTLKEFRDDLRDAKEKIVAAQKEAIEIVANVKETAGLSALAIQAQVFEEEAGDHNAAAKVWAWSAMASMVLLVGYAYISYAYFKIPKDDASLAAQLIFSKALIGGVLVYALVLSSRNFMFNKHNAVINKHRHNSLVVSQTLIGAANAPDNREALLVQAAAAIFAPQDTGFAKTSADNSSIKLIEVAPKMGGGGS